MYVMYNVCTCVQCMYNVHTFFPAICHLYTLPNFDKALCSARESALWLYLVIHLDMDSLSPWGAPGWTEGPGFWCNSSPPLLSIFLTIIILIIFPVIWGLEIRQQTRGFCSFENCRNYSLPSAAMQNVCECVHAVHLISSQSSSFWAGGSSKVYWLAGLGGQRGVTRCNAPYALLNTHLYIFMQSVLLQCRTPRNFISCILGCSLIILHSGLDSQ